VDCRRLLSDERYGALVYRARSLSHLIETVNDLEARSVSFRSLTEAIDTTTPGGRLILHIFGALGQFERHLIRERTRAGLDAAMARGHQGGRKPVATDEKLRPRKRLSHKVSRLAKPRPVSRWARLRFMLHSLK
jgi:DNA invertase Pin-like site-specific DNA recombinase